MKLVERWSNKKRAFSIQQAIDAQTYADSSGVAERAADRADNTAQIIGQVVQMLYENGSLTEQNILELCTGFEKQGDDNAG